MSIEPNLYLYKNVNLATCFGYVTVHHQTAYKKVKWWNLQL